MRDCDLEFCPAQVPLQLCFSKKLSEYRRHVKRFRLSCPLPVPVRFPNEAAVLSDDEKITSEFSREPERDQGVSKSHGVWRRDSGEVLHFHNREDSPVRAPYQNVCARVTHLEQYTLLCEVRPPLVLIA